LGDIWFSEMISQLMPYSDQPQHIRSHCTRHWFQNLARKAYFLFTENGRSWWNRYWISGH